MDILTPDYILFGTTDLIDTIDLGFDYNELLNSD